MFTYGELGPKVGRQLIKIKQGIISNKETISDFKKTHAWSKDLLSEEGGESKIFNNLVSGEVTIRSKRLTKEPVEKKLPVTHQEKPYAAEVSVCGKDYILRILCGKNSQHKYVVHEYELEKIL
ncbi:MAG: hypothetical protein ACI88L_000193 [Candidatus Paceibacteria bacterium]|jgi:hypothetical protein